MLCQSKTETAGKDFAGLPAAFPTLEMRARMFRRRCRQAVCYGGCSRCSRCRRCSKRHKSLAGSGGQNRQNRQNRNYQNLNFRLFRLCVSKFVARFGDRTEVAFRTTASGICSVASWVCRGETQNANNLLNHQFVGGVRGFCHIFRQFGS